MKRALPLVGAAGVPPGDGAPRFVSRRELLLGAAAAAALASCSRAPDRTIVPYVADPPEVTPGRPTFYATAMTLDGYATGLLVESHEGRPTKVEGNPAHPASLGASSAWNQAAVLELYDPSRARAPTHGGAPVAWSAIDEVLARAGDRARRGAGVHVVLEPTSSPTLSALLDRLSAELPLARVHFDTGAPRGNAWEGARAALGEVLEPRFDLARADVVVAIDDDFLAAGPASLALARAFASRRRLRAAADGMNRLYAVEPRTTVTGSFADHRLAVRDALVPAVAAALVDEVARALGGDALAAVPPAVAASLARARARAASHDRFVRAVARDLVAHRRAAAVLVGDRQPPAVHAAAHALNAMLGGAAVTLARSPIRDAGGKTHDRGELARALDAGEVDTLIVLEGNPAFTAPSDARLAERFAKARTTVYVGVFENETARACAWFVPAAHWLETWSDARAFDGTASVVQPLIAPLYAGRTPAEILAGVLGRAAPAAHELVRDTWRRTLPGPFERAWARLLARGVAEGTAFPAVAAPPVRWDALAALDGAPSGDAIDLDLVLAPDARVHDGRFAGNPWLEELPDPVTRTTWGGPARLSKATAARLGVADGDVVTLEATGAPPLEIPVAIVSGHPDDVAHVPLGYGRRAGERAAIGVGADAHRFATLASPYGGARAVKIRPTGRREDLARTQRQTVIPDERGDEIAVHATLAELHARPELTRDRNERPKTLYEPPARTAPNQWGMAVDLAACTGCSACVVACQAENNVPVVGRDGVLNHREMHWLRVDRYEVDERTVVSQPMACQHCETAPCEYVCPTNATVHSQEGLNQMVYNRCVGTRFCSNNCPYKVRRFNWFAYQAELRGTTRDLVFNPDVTVRDRGVMEKCTYCVQRIREAEIRAAVAGRGEGALPDGEVRTACQQACPTGAIVFGNVADPSSQVARLHASGRAYHALHDLGTVPRTRYLAAIKNPNPELA